MSVPDPGTFAKKLRAAQEELQALERSYKQLYSGAYSPKMSGSLGVIGKGSESREPRAAYPQLESSCYYVQKRVSKALRLLREANNRASDAWGELPGGINEPRWYVSRWTDLECGCCKDDHGWWIVSRECSEHMRLIPIQDRVPFGEILEMGAQFGPFKPQVKP